MSLRGMDMCIHERQKVLLFEARRVVRAFVNHGGKSLGHTHYQGVTDELVPVCSPHTTGCSLMANLTENMQEGEEKKPTSRV